MQYLLGDGLGICSLFFNKDGVVGCLNFDISKINTAQQVHDLATGLLFDTKVENFVPQPADEASISVLGIVDGAQDVAPKVYVRYSKQ